MATLKIDFRDLLNFRAAIVAAIAVLLLLLICAAIAVAFGEYYFSQSHPVVLWMAFPLFPGFLVDTYVSHNVNLGRLLWYDYVVTVGVSWMVWTALAWATLMWWERRRLLLGMTSGTAD